ncbi:hypothetical protein E0504_26550 [Parafrankia sp. BMG5.11]|nr:hypothetical protein E0504_26550 [Parafrankia sp. BMG5.11]
MLPARAGGRAAVACRARRTRTGEDDHGRSLTTAALRDAAGRAAAGLRGHGSGPRAGCPVDVGVQYL